MSGLSGDLGRAAPGVDMTHPGLGETHEKTKGSTIEFVGLMVRSSSGIIVFGGGVAQGVRSESCSTLKCRPRHVFHPGEVFRDDAGLVGLWLCFVDETPG